VKVGIRSFNGSTQSKGFISYHITGL